MRDVRFGAIRSLLVLAVAVTSVTVQSAEDAGYESWKREVIRVGLDPDDVIYPFSATPEMVAWAEDAMHAHVGNDPVLRLRRLQEAMFNDRSFDFAYDMYQTFTAEEAFDARHGNCMSFTVLFVSLARSAGIPTQLMSVRRSPEVERDGGLVVINRHVAAGYRYGNEAVTFDFNLSSATPPISRRMIDDIEASAMFHNNLGGSALRAGDEADARRHFEIATRLWPGWATGWVNYGVTLVRLDDIDGAFEAYGRALEVDPGNSSALNNLSYLYKLLGRDAEADNARRAAAKTTENPFALIAMADSAMMRGNMDEAKRYLRRARWSYPREPEVYEGLARLAKFQGKLIRAEKRMKKAEKLRRQERDQ